MSYMTSALDLVMACKLETEFLTGPSDVRHVYYGARGNSKQRRLRTEARWKKTKKVGAGAFGVVWVEECYQGRQEGEVRAVKKIQKTSSSDHYQRELYAIALFSLETYKDCFVESHGWYEDEENLYIVMEYLPDGDLGRYLTRPFSESETQLITFQVLEGLQFMHERGFAHRDLKPANILVVNKGPDWWVKIADFGISKRAKEDSTELRTAIGTRDFMAPEIHLSSGHASGKAYTCSVDVWSLGVIAYLMLTGEMPFDLGKLVNYAAGRISFPVEGLVAKNITEPGLNFLQSSMTANAERRSPVQTCLGHPWISFQRHSSEAQSHPIRPKSWQPSLLQSTETPSAGWSTQKRLQGPTFRKSAGGSKSNTVRSGTTQAFSTQSEVEPSASWSTHEQYRGPERASISNLHGSAGKFANVNASAPKIAPRKERLLLTKYHLQCTLKAHQRDAFTLAFSPDCKKIATGSLDLTVWLWDAATGAELHRLGCHQDSVCIVRFSSDGEQIASGSEDCTIKLWDVATGVELSTLKGHEELVGMVEFSPDGTQIASSSGRKDRTIKLWDTDTEEVLHTLEGEEEWAISLKFSPDGKQLASGSKNTIKLWDVATGAALRTLEGHEGKVRSITFSLDGKQILSESNDDTIKVWDVAAGAALSTHEVDKKSMRILRGSPDGKSLIVTDSRNETMKLWDAATGPRVYMLNDYLSYGLRRVWCSPDGKQIVTDSQSSHIQLWGVDTRPSASS